MPTEAVALVSLRGAGLTYADGTRALSGAEVVVRAGTLTALIGPNGAGKSTMLGLLAGGLAPTDGEVSFAGEGRARDRARLVTQEPALDPEMTGRETMRLFAALSSVAEERRGATIAEVVRRFGLEDQVERLVASYSGGFRQRLHLALAMLDEPPLMLLDEPGAGLDPGSRALVWEGMRSYPAAGRALLVATHELPEAERHADWIVVLAGGAIVAQGSPADLRARYAKARLVVELEPACDGEALLASLREHASVVEARLREARLVVYHEGGAEVILAHLTRGEASIVAFRREPADLGSAYFRLTEEGPIPPRGARRGRGGGGGGGGRRRP